MGKKIVWTRHAEERLNEWSRKKGITRWDVENILKDPGQIVPGDLDAQVAQAKNKGGLIRIPFIEDEGIQKVLTLYWTSKVEKYWRMTDES